MTKLAAALPKDDKNGLDAISGALIRRPHHQHVAMVILDCRKVTTDYETGDVVPTAQVRRIEVLDPADVPRAEQLMRRAVERRTNAQVLDRDTEDELQMIFQNVDPETGELITGPETTTSHRDDTPDTDSGPGSDD